VQAVQGLRGQKNMPFENWTALVDEMDAWNGNSVIMSMEFMSLAKADAIARAIESLGKHRVRVLLTMRDIGRAIPAQWQESLQNGHSWSYPEYLSGVTQRQPRLSQAGRHFWSKQDPVKILSAWGAHVGVRDLLLVTVPPAGAAPGLLWQRVCEAAGLPPERFDSTVRTNESLGAASAEVMRFVMARADEAEVDQMTRRTMKMVLAKEIMSSRKAEEPTVVLPAEHQAWAVKRGRRMVDELREFGPTVIGDLSDLVPQFPPPRGAVTDDPGTVGVPELMAAAAFGLVGLSEQVARRGRGKGDRGHNS
jgi:hypothetical protein